MLDLMHEYGSEISDTAMPPRRSCVQKASVVRQFRQWNPNFLEYFEHRNGRWVPKLGKVIELQRREQSRRDIATMKTTKHKYFLIMELFYHIKLSFLGARYYPVKQGILNGGMF